MENTVGQINVNLVNGGVTSNSEQESDIYQEVEGVLV